MSANTISQTPSQTFLRHTRILINKDLNLANQHPERYDIRLIDQLQFIENSERTAT